MKKINLGIIGCGIAAQDLHFPAIQKLRNRFRIAVLCNRSREKAMALREKYQEGEIVNSYREVLEHPEVEAVVISLPIPMNAPVSIKALKAGKHVLCEKPIAMLPDEAERVVKVASKTRKVFMVGESAAYNPNLVKAKELINSGIVGKIFHAKDTAYWKHNENNKYQRTVWRKKPEYFGGFFFDGGVHFMSQALELLGEAESVSGQAMDKRFDRLQDNAVAMTFRMKNKALLQMNFVMTSIERPIRRLRLFGSKANLELYMDNLDMVFPDGRRKAIALSHATGFEMEFRDFYNAVVNGKKPLMGVWKGARDVATLYAGLMAAYQGKEVSVNLK